MCNGLSLDLVQPSWHGANGPVPVYPHLNVTALHCLLIDLSQDLVFFVDILVA
jgi:hypothetical protein